MNRIALPLPSEMTASDRAAEITTILATALLRTQCQESPDPNAVRLDLLLDRSVHATPYLQEKCT